MTDIIAREQAVLMSSDIPAVAELDQIESCIANNKGLIMGCMTSLPMPILAILKSIAHLLLMPLHVIASLPLGSIYSGLNNFANSPSVAPTPVNTSDCVPTQIV